MDNIFIIYKCHIEKINLEKYNYRTRKIILTNLKKFTKLIHFQCDNCNLTELPELPSSLKTLWCNNNNLTKLPDLPNSLTQLVCHSNNLKKLPNLPNSLIHLYCQNNNLTELPNLPNTLNDLYCQNNNLTELPNLPNSLIWIHCYFNRLTELPNLPNSLISLDCKNNNLTELPDLPNSLIYLFCSGNNCDLIYHINGIHQVNAKIIIINESNSKKRIIKRMKLLNRTLLLEQSARICLNPKRIQRLLNTNEIDFFDGSFDSLTS